MVATESTAVRIIDKMLEILATPDRWTKNVNARSTKWGAPVDLSSSQAKAFCLDAARHLAMRRLGVARDGGTAVAMDRVARRLHGKTTYEFNDYKKQLNDPESGTQHADILAFLKEVRVEMATA